MDEIPSKSAKKNERVGKARHGKCLANGTCFNCVGPKKGGLRGRGLKKAASSLAVSGVGSWGQVGMHFFLCQASNMKQKNRSLHILCHRNDGKGVLRAR